MGVFHDPNYLVSYYFKHSSTGPLYHTTVLKGAKELREFLEKQRKEDWHIDVYELVLLDEDEINEAIS